LETFVEQEIAHNEPVKLVGTVGKTLIKCEIFENQEVEVRL
jgi:hypothetical protein